MRLRGGLGASFRPLRPISRFSSFFSGGRADLEDDGPKATAAREAREEVGIDLTAAQWLGALEPISMRRRLRSMSGLVSPFVFYAGENAPALRPDPADDPVIRGLTYDSRAVAPGDLFVALRGSAADGHRYIDQALSLGAQGLLA